MSDDKSKRGGADRARVASTQKHEVDYVAKKAGVSTPTARKAAKRAGPSRAKVEPELKRS